MGPDDGPAWITTQVDWYFSHTIMISSKLDRPVPDIFKPIDADGSPMSVLCSSFNNVLQRTQSGNAV